MLRLKPRRKGQLSTFAIYPPECWLNGEIGRFNLSTELGRVKARSHKQAVELARAQGIGAGLEIFAVEVPDANRVVYQVNAPHPAGSVATTTTNDDTAVTMANTAETGGTRSTPNSGAADVKGEGAAPECEA